jgi:hypothetical protein
MPVLHSASPPPAGAAAPGNLYADLPSRTIWLGVVAAVDPAQAVLMADQQGTDQAISDAQAAANSYTDNKLTGAISPGYSPVGHTHVHTDITDFDAAVTAVASAIPQLQFVAGMVMLWSGSAAEIGTGPLVGWALCDGTSYGGFTTPDLRDRFIVGAGNKPVGAVNIPGTVADTSTDGQHNHLINGTVLTVAQLPAHVHTFSDTSSVTSSAGAHSHTLDLYNTNQVPAGGPSGILMYRSDSGESAKPTSVAGAHTHTVAVSGTTSSQGSGATHTHTENNAGNHAHTISGAELREALPYYALAYIIKLP